MAAREPVAVRALREIGQAQRLGFDDQRAQNTPAAGAGSDGEFLIRLEADGEELVERRAVLAQHAECPVTGIDERTCLSDQVAEDDRKAQFSLHHEHRLYEPPELDGVVDLIERSHRSQGSWSGGSGVRRGPARACAPPSGLHRGNIVGMKIRIFILDDHELVRTGLKTLLDAEDDMDVIGQAATAQQGLEEIGALLPDVAILDVRLPDGSGIEVCREIRSLYPDVACLMLTSYADDDALFSAIMAGAAGYVLKEIGGSDLIGDIRRVSQGRSLIDATLSKEIFDRLRKSQKTEARLSVSRPRSGASST